MYNEFRIYKRIVSDTSLWIMFHFCFFLDMDSQPNSSSSRSPSPIVSVAITSCEHERQGIVNSDDDVMSDDAPFVENWNPCCKFHVSLLSLSLSLLSLLFLHSSFTCDSCYIFYYKFFTFFSVFIAVKSS